MPILKTAEELKDLVIQILQNVGASRGNAARVAEGLVSANLCGMDSHGVFVLPTYVGRIKNGEIIADARPQVLKESRTSALVGGNWTFGHVTAKFGMELAIEKASLGNVAVVSLVQLLHIGRLGEYAEMAASQGMISLIWVGGLGVETPVAVPYGGSKAVLHTNPIAMGFPAAEEPPVIIDYATTVTANVKIRMALEKGEQLPEGTIVDKDGNPTTDPAAFFDGGAHLPFGAHKGYAIMLAAEFLGRILSGADTFTAGRQGGALFRHSGATLIAFRADLFQPLKEYCARVDELQRRIRAIPPASGFKEVLVPGDLEARTRDLRQKESIPIPEDLWQKLRELARSSKTD